MSEINGSNFSVNQIKFNGIQKQKQENVPEQVVEESTPKLTDFSDSKAEALGRSMLIKGADSLNNDLKALIDNPQIAENADELFEETYNIALKDGVENPYEVASTASTTSF